MRRQEFETIEREHILSILEKNHVLYLALFDEYCPYVIPVNYGYDWQDETLFFYIHGAKQGKKKTLLARNSKIGFELDYFPIPTDGEQNEEEAHQYSSLLGEGIASVLTDLKEKKHALLKMIEHGTGKYIYEVSSSKIRHTEIIKIEVTSITAE